MKRETSAFARLIADLGLDLTGLTDRELLALVRQEYATSRGKADPAEVSRNALATYLTEATKITVYNTQVQRVEVEKGSLNAPLRAAIISFLISRRTAGAGASADALETTLPNVFARDEATQPIWALLRVVLRRAYARSLTITDVGGRHILGVGITSPVCQELYLYSKEGGPPACLRYDRDMSVLAHRRLTSAPREDLFAEIARHFSVARCPAGFIALAVPWTPRVHLHGEILRARESNDAGVISILDRLEEMFLVFHVGEACIRELDHPDGKQDADAALRLIRKHWDWHVEPRRNGVQSSPSHHLSDFLGGAAVRGWAEDWTAAIEDSYRHEVASWLSTPSPIARTLRAPEDDEAKKAFRRTFELGPDSWHQLQLKFKAQVESQAADDDSARDLFRLAGFVGSCPPIHDIVTRAANIALRQWLTTYSSHPTLLAVAKALFANRRVDAEGMANGE